jgi:hypothetical protein
MRRISIAIALSTFLFVSMASAQRATSTTVPNLIRYSGTLKDAEGAALPSTATGVTFAIYKQQDGGASVWMETQTVTPDANGNYSVLLGSTTATGLPTDLFSQQEQRWLGVQIQGLAEGPRVLLVSVPYAFKAHEAETLGGKSLSDFVLANGANSPANGCNANQTSSSTGSHLTATAAGAKKGAASDGPTNFSGSTTDQIVGVTQSGTGAGIISSASSKALVGTATSTSGTAIGVEGGSNGSGGYGVYGNVTSATGATVGVKGNSQSSAGTGVRGTNIATTGATTGVSGYVNSAAGTAGSFNNAAGGMILSGQNNGVVKLSVDGSGNITSQGTLSGAGMTGTTSAATGVGLTGNATNTTGANTGVMGETASINGTGVAGYANTTTGSNVGVYGQTNSNAGWGVYGEADSTSGQTFGVEGNNQSSGQNSSGVLGYENSATGAVYGVQGFSASSQGVGIQANNTATGGAVALAGPSPYLINASVGSSGAFTVDDSGNGFYGGNLLVTGTLTAPGIVSTGFITGGELVSIDLSTGLMGLGGFFAGAADEIQDMGDSSSGLLHLRPVSFYYKPEYAHGTHELQYGLVAEEVAKVYPELVTYRKGQPYTIRYQLLEPMLLNELQKQHAVVSAQQNVIKSQQERVNVQQQQMQAQQQQIEQIQQRLSRLESLIANK